MQYVAVAAAVLSAVGSIKQGQYQQASLNMQAMQARTNATAAELEGRQNALNYNKQALDVLERQRKMSATLIARGAAGGIDPFSGSPMSVDQWNAFKAGEEYNLGIENADMAIASGLAKSQMFEAQSASYVAAGKQAMRQAYISAAASLAQGAYSYSKLSTPSAGAGSKGLDPGLAYENAITNSAYYGQSAPTGIRVG
jgi:hypothetical protein